MKFLLLTINNIHGYTAHNKIMSVKIYFFRYDIQTLTEYVIYRWNSLFYLSTILNKKIGITKI